MFVIQEEVVFVSQVVNTNTFAELGTDIATLIK